MQGGYAVQMVRRELENVDVIWRRFLRIREALLTVTARMDYLSDLGFLNTPQQKRLDIQYDELVATLKVDVIALFVFGDILLTKLVLLVDAVDKKKAGHLHGFSAFLSQMKDQPPDETILSRIYHADSATAHKVDNVLGFYRDNFIVHPDRPYSEGIVVGVNHREFKLSHTAHGKVPGFEKYAIKLPVHLRGQLAKCRTLREKTATLTLNRHEIPKGLRKDGDQFIRAVGAETPNVYYVVRDLVEVSGSFLHEVRQELARYRAP